MVLNGRGKHSIEVSENGVNITSNKVDTYIPLNEITTVEIAKPTTLYPGLLRVSVAGSRNTALNVPALAKSDADNIMRTIIFNKADFETAQAVRDFIVAHKAGGV